MSTDTLSSYADKSTNVRSRNARHDEALYASAWPLRALLTLSPELAGRAAARAFFKTWRPAVRPDEAALLAGFERLSIPFGARRLAGWSLGEGPLVLLSHGWSGRGAQLAPLAGALATAGFRALTFDHPAHGESAGESTTLPEMRDALAAVDAWAGGADAIVAHSMGTILSTLALTRAGFAPKRLVYIAPPLMPHTWPVGFARKLGLGEAIDAAMQRAVERRAGVTLGSLDPAPVAATRHEPLLIIHDREDREVPFASGQALQKLWRGAELIDTRGLGHYRVLRDPIIGEQILGFVAGA